MKYLAITKVKLRSSLPKKKMIIVCSRELIKTHKKYDSKSLIKLKKKNKENKKYDPKKKDIIYFFFFHYES